LSTQLIKNKKRKKEKPPLATRTARGPLGTVAGQAPPPANLRRQSTSAVGQPPARKGSAIQFHGPRPDPVLTLTVRNFSPVSTDTRHRGAPVGGPAVGRRRGWRVRAARRGRADAWVGLGGAAGGTELGTARACRPGDGGWR
jgi:hypothetical protein